MAFCGKGGQRGPCGAGSGAGIAETVEVMEPRCRHIQPSVMGAPHKLALGGGDTSRARVVCGTCPDDCAPLMLRSDSGSFGIDEDCVEVQLYYTDNSSFIILIIVCKD